MAHINFLPLSSISLNHPAPIPAAIDGMSAARTKRAAAGRAVGHGRQPHQPQPLHATSTPPPAPITTGPTAADVLAARYGPLDMGIFTPVSAFSDINHLAVAFNGDGDVRGDNSINIGGHVDGGAARGRDGRGAKKRARVSDGSESESEGDINGGGAAPSVSYAALTACPYLSTSANGLAHHAAQAHNVGAGVGELTPPPLPWPPASTDASAAAATGVNRDLATMSVLSPEVMFALLAANAAANPNASTVCTQPAAAPPPPDLAELAHKHSRALAKANTKAALTKREYAQKNAALQKQLTACKTRLDKERSDNFFLMSGWLRMKEQVEGLVAEVQGLEVRVWVAETQARARTTEGEEGDVKVKMQEGGEEDVKVKLEEEADEVKVKVEVM